MHRIRLLIQKEILELEEQYKLSKMMQKVLDMELPLKEIIDKIEAVVVDSSGKVMVKWK